MENTNGAFDSRVELTEGHSNTIVANVPHLGQKLVCQNFGQTQVCHNSGQILVSHKFGHLCVTTLVK